MYSLLIEPVIKEIKRTWFWWQLDGHLYTHCMLLDRKLDLLEEENKLLSDAVKYLKSKLDEHHIDV